MVIGSGILGTFNNTGTLLLVMAVVMCFAGAANALNDVVDYEIDKINRPMRPLPSGFVKKRTALFISILLFSMGLSGTFGSGQSDRDFDCHAIYGSVF